MYKIDGKKDYYPFTGMKHPHEMQKEYEKYFKVYPYRYAFADPTVEGVQDRLRVSNVKKQKKKNENIGTNTNQISKAEEEALRRERERQEKIGRLNSEKTKAIERMNQNLDLQKKEAKVTNENNLKDIYVTYMQGIKNMPQQTALWGAGGEIESLKNQKRMNYEDNRVKENAKHNSILNDLQKQYNNDLMELERKYMQMLISI